MPTGDPYRRASTLTYECADCGTRVRAEHQPGECPECGGQLLDVSVPRE